MQTPRLLAPVTAILAASLAATALPGAAHAQETSSIDVNDVFEMVSNLPDTPNGPFSYMFTKSERVSDVLSENSGGYFDSLYAAQQGWFGPSGWAIDARSSVAWGSTGSGAATDVTSYTDVFRAGESVCEKNCNGRKKVAWMATFPLTVSPEELDSVRVQEYVRVKKLDEFYPQTPANAALDFLGTIAIPADALVESETVNESTIYSGVISTADPQAGPLELTFSLTVKDSAVVEFVAEGQVDANANTMGYIVDLDVMSRLRNPGARTPGAPADPGSLPLFDTVLKNDMRKQADKVAKRAVKQLRQVAKETSAVITEDFVMDNLDSAVAKASRGVEGEMTKTHPGIHPVTLGGREIRILVRCSAVAVQAHGATVDCPDMSVLLTVENGKVRARKAELDTTFAPTERTAA